MNAIIKDLEINNIKIAELGLHIDTLLESRDAALARAEKAEAWIETHEQYLSDMEKSLIYGGVITSKRVREWFELIEWFDAPDPATAEGETT